MNKPPTPYFGTLLHPARSFAALLRHPHYFRLGFLYMLVPLVAYTLMYVFLTIAHGAPSVFTPWLNIAKEDYYALNRFLLAPSMLLAWLATTALAQVLSRIAGGRGSFEQTLTTLALAISVSMWGGLLHDLPMSFCSAIGIIDARQHELDMNAPTIYRTLLWIAYSLYFLAFGILFPAAIRAVHGLSRGWSVAIGLTVFVLFQLVFLVFNR